MGTVRFYKTSCNSHFHDVVLFNTVHMIQCLLIQTIKLIILWCLEAAWHSPKFSMPNLLTVVIHQKFIPLKNCAVHILILILEYDKKHKVDHEAPYQRLFEKSCKITSTCPPVLYLMFE